jgi:flavin reductase (DIM6/NTAB) family NADH-FMN oxidoreductase RutF
MNRVFREILFGDAEIKEYAAITTDGQINEKVYLWDNTTTTDISESHWLLCLDPVIFGIWVPKAPARLQQDYKMYFRDPIAGIQKKGKTVAELSLDYFDQLADEDGSLLLLKVRRSRVNHISLVQTHLLYLKYYKKPKSSFENLKSLAAAYSYPRKVRLISFKEDNYYNIFPMDLLGGIPKGNKYVFGLRHTNTALSKMIKSKKIVVSEVPFEFKKTIYQLGSHHSAGPVAIELLPFKVISSRNFGFPVPEWADSYQEIRIDKTLNLGSHMLLWGEIQEICVLKTSTGNLFHIHYLLYLHQKRNGLVYSLV